MVKKLESTTGNKMVDNGTEGIYQNSYQPTTSEKPAQLPKKGSGGKK